jgi:hypothetical protein
MNIETNEDVYSRGSSSMIVETNINDNNTNDILQLLQDFFENSWYFIQQAEEELNSDINVSTLERRYVTGVDALRRPVKSVIDTEKNRENRLEYRNRGQKESKTVLLNNKRVFNGGAVSSDFLEIKRLYYTLYLFFACLYEDIPDDQMSMINMIKQGNFSNPMAINNYINYSLLKNNVFFNNYISDYPESGIIYNDDIRAANLKIIIKYCLKIRFEKPKQIDNYVLFIFTFFVNYLKFYVEIAARNAINAINPNAINNTNLSTFGYYPGIMNDFTNTGSIQTLFRKINAVTNAATNSNSNFNFNAATNSNFNAATNTDLSLINTGSLSETLNHVAIFKQIDIILKSLLMYTFDPNRAQTHLSVINSLSVSKGGKRTRRKKSKQRKQRKTMRRRK